MTLLRAGVSSIGVQARLAVTAALLLPLLAGCLHKGSDEGDRLERTWDWLLSRRDDEGKWPPAQVPYLVEAAVANGEDPSTWPAPVPLAEQLEFPDEGQPLLASLRALHAWSLLPGGAAGRADEVRDQLLQGWDDSQFGDPKLVNDDVFAVWTLAQLDGAAAAAPYAGSLLTNQTPGGGWSWSTGGQAQTDMTGMALVSLDAAGVLRQADLDAAQRFLASTKTTDAGHSLQHEAGAAQAAAVGNCDSTVWALRAYQAVGAKSPAATWAFLRGLQQPDGGWAYTAGGPGNDLCTVEVATLLGSVA